MKPIFELCISSLILDNHKKFGMMSLLWVFGSQVISNLLSALQFFGYLNPKLTAVNMDSKFLNRNVNEGFSGGEKKRNEILQLAVHIL